MSEQQNSGPNINDIQIHNFSKGWNYDIENHAESPENYIDAWNGRLYSHDGTLAFTSIDGTKLVYEDDRIVSYNGFHSFKDEMICFVKGNFPAFNEETEPKEVTEVICKNFSVSPSSSNSNTITGVPFELNYSKNTVIIQVPIENSDNDDFKQNLTEVSDINVIDETYNGLFQSVLYNPTNPIACSISNLDPPINNLLYNDAILSFRINENKELVSTVLWSGWLNIPLNAVITTEGVEENNYYKRVYFSDYYNASRVVNIKDPNLQNRKNEELSLKSKGILLNPRIKSINRNGQLKAMTVFYVMKLITDNGQSSDFSPLSKGVKIAISEGSTFKGGGISETTNKSVSIDCYIPDYKNFREVMLVAIEYEAKDIPTTIRLVGKKEVNAIVSFEHFGTEPEYAENITLADLFKNSISWKYNSDYTTQNNKLITTGLRNDPLIINSKEMALDFSLSAFDENGNTHNSLLNPDPVLFNYIDNSATEPFFYTERRLYRKINVFGNFKVSLKNTVTGVYYEKEFPEIVYEYVDRKKIYLIF